MTPQDVLDFWFSDRVRPLQFEKNPDFDKEITDKFLAYYEAATAHKLEGWLETAKGALALIIVLDQFARNMFRDTPKSFAADPQALSIANMALEEGFDEAVSPKQRHFFYMPFMHSEDLADQDRCVALFSDLGNEDALHFAKLHRDIIARFGRFPHRNQVLSRESTPEEEAFLKEPNSSF